MKKIISVNRQALQKGEPAVSVKAGGKTYACYEAWIDGPSAVLHDVNKKRQPRVWITTNAPVECWTGDEEVMLP